jgi:hypothetical protein
LVRGDFDWLGATTVDRRSDQAEINFGHPMIVASATAFVCCSCRVIEFGSANQVQQQQQQSENDKKQ